MLSPILELIFRIVRNSVNKQYYDWISAVIVLIYIIVNEQYSCFQLRPWGGGISKYYLPCLINKLIFWCRLSCLGFWCRCSYFGVWCCHSCFGVVVVTLAFGVVVVTLAFGVVAVALAFWRFGVLAFWRFGVLAVSWLFIHNLWNNKNNSETYFSTTTMLWGKIEAQ